MILVKMMENDNYLCHHGVKGMKWGRRKQRSKSKVVKKTNKSKEAKQKILTDSRKAVLKDLGKAALLAGWFVAIKIAKQYAYSWSSDYYNVDPETGLYRGRSK